MQLRAFVILLIIPYVWTKGLTSWPALGFTAQQEQRAVSLRSSATARMEAAQEEEEVGVSDSNSHSITIHACCARLFPTKKTLQKQQLQEGGEGCTGRR